MSEEKKSPPSSAEVSSPFARKAARARARIRVFFAPPWRRYAAGASILAVSGLGVFIRSAFMSSSVFAASSPAMQPASASGAVSPSIELADLPPYTVDALGSAEIVRVSEMRTIVPDRPRLKVVQYVVQAGDTLFAIAEDFGLKAETLLWGNYDVLKDDPHGLRPGQELNILPVDGTYYAWNEGDQLSAVADFFGVEVENILDWPGNDLPPDIDRENPQIEPGTKLIIPGGQREIVTWRAPRITRGNPAVAKVSGPGACGSIYDGPVGEGFFIWPTTANFLSGYGYSSIHPGLDIAGSMGNAIYASASGVVVYAGWNNYGYGYMVVIDHGDGWQTLYAHMNQVNVACGQAVFQGNVIGGVGSSGNSTGAHLHFEMESDNYGKVNPYNFVSP